MGQALDGDGFDKGVGDDDFFFAQGGRVAFVGSGDVGLQELTEARQAGKEVEGQGARGGVEFFSAQVRGWRVFQAFIDFSLQVAGDGAEQSGGLLFDFGRMHRLFLKKTREEQEEQVHGNGRNRALGGKIFSVQMVDASHVGVGGN